MTSILYKTFQQIRYLLGEIAVINSRRQIASRHHHPFLMRNHTQQEPIRLNFDIPKKHRLNWLRRTIHDQASLDR